MAALNLFKSLVGYLFSNDAEKMAEAKPLKYIAAGNGTFEVRDNQLMQVAKKLDGVPSLPAIKEGIQLHIPKIPFNVFNLMVSFMKKVYEADTTESTAMVFYNKERNEFITWIPLQTNGGASSNYKRDEDEEYTRMCQENILVMVAHSHPWGSGGISTTSPSPSGIDDKDEKEAILYMVVGNVKGVPTTCVSTCPGGKRMKLKFFEVFENPMLPSGATDEASSLIAKYVPDHEIFPMFVNTNMEVPEAWYKRCTKQVYTYGSGYSRYWGGSQYGKGPGSDEDPAVQYYKHRYDYGRDYDDYDEGYEYSNYSNYYYGRQEGARGSAFEDMSDEEYEQAYKDKLLSRSESVEVEAHVLEDEEEDLEDQAAYELVDVVDACLGFTDVQIAQLLFALISEGYGSLIDKCLKAKAEMKKSTAIVPSGAGAKSGGIPGLKLVKHGEHEDGGKE